MIVLGLCHERGVDKSMKGVWITKSQWITNLCGLVLVCWWSCAFAAQKRHPVLHPWQGEWLLLLCSENQTIDQLLFMSDYPHIVHWVFKLDLPTLAWTCILLTLFKYFLQRVHKEMINTTKGLSHYLPILFDNKVIGKALLFPQRTSKAQQMSYFCNVKVLQIMLVTSSGWALWSVTSPLKAIHVNHKLTSLWFIWHCKITKSMKET